MAEEEYDLRIVETVTADPDFLIDNDSHVITYIYSGDPSELAILAQRAGASLARRRQVPVLPSVE